jgi:hypothetical protein
MILTDNVVKILGAPFAGKYFVSHVFLRIVKIGGLAAAMRNFYIYRIAPALTSR